MAGIGETGVGEPAVDEATVNGTAPGNKDARSATAPTLTAQALELLRGRVLVLTPGYPAVGDEYAFGFVHTRCQAYLAAGLAVDVVAVDGATAVTQDEFEGVRVVRMPLPVLGSVLRERHYDVICVHFLDRHNARVLEGTDLWGTQVLLWCHGGETLYWDTAKFTTGYFQPARRIGDEERRRYEDRDRILARLDVMPNVTWVFVSEFVRTRARELTGVGFSRSVVIHNWIDGGLFRYERKDPELRKHVFMVRKWDDSGCYALDTVVRTIVELSRRPYFHDLTFEVCGTGPRHDEMVAPLVGMENVHIVNRFLSHEEMAQIHRTCGVALFPTRFDAQGVSMLEAASSGLAVVSTDRQSVADFLPDDLGLLVPVDDYRAYADVIERLYRDPLYFERCSEACAEKAQRICGRAATIDAECELIGRLVGEKGEKPASEEFGSERGDASAKPVLSLVVPRDAEADAAALEDVTQRWGLPVEVVRASKPSEALGLVHAPWVRFMSAGDQVEAPGLGELCRFLTQGTTARVVLTGFLRGIPYQPNSGEGGAFPFMCDGVTYSMRDLTRPPYGFGDELPSLAGSVISASRLCQLADKGFEDLIDAGDDLLAGVAASEVAYLPVQAWCVGAVPDRSSWPKASVTQARRREFVRTCAAPEVAEWLEGRYMGAETPVERPGAAPASATPVATASTPGREEHRRGILGRFGRFGKK